jgi:hypothetical protein
MMQTVPVEQALSFYEALLKAGASGEIHIFAHGSHGSGLGAGDASLDQWPNSARKLAARPWPVYAGRCRYRRPLTAVPLTLGEVRVFIGSDFSGVICFPQTSSGNRLSYCGFPF